MKNKKLFFIIYIVFITITIVSIIVLSILGKKERLGYLSELKINVDRTLELNGLIHIKYDYIIDNKFDEESLKNYIFTNNSITNYSYNFRIKYYSKVFRNSDIYGVYVDTNKVIQDNNFIKEIKMGRNGSPFGDLVSTKELNSDYKIDNINYKLKIKRTLLLISICLALLAVFIFIYKISKNKIKLLLDNIINYQINYDSKYNNKYLIDKKILNIAFIIYIIILSIFLLSFGFIKIIGFDDWYFSSTRDGYYNIFDFFTSNTWHRGRHFPEFLASLSFKTGTQILSSFNIEPLLGLKILKSFFMFFYGNIFIVGLSTIIWIINNRKNYKLIYVSISLYFVYTIFKINDSIYYTFYIASGGISLLIFIPYIILFIENKKIIYLNNNSLYLALTIFLSYTMCFSGEVTSLFIAGISSFMILYLIYDYKIYKRNINIELLGTLFLFIIMSSIAFILSITGGRAKVQMDVMIGSNSMIEIFKNQYRNLSYIDKTLIYLSILFLIYYLIYFIKEKSISKNNYTIFTITFVSLLGIVGILSINTSVIWIYLLSLFGVFVSILLKFINNKNYLKSFVASFILIYIIITISLLNLQSYSCFYSSNGYKYKLDKELVELFKKADMEGLDTLVIKIKNNELMKEYIMPQYYMYHFISEWMLFHGYTRKYIKLEVS